jgi:hypothetical protein
VCDTHLLRELLHQPAGVLLPWQQLLGHQLEAQAALLLLVVWLCRLLLLELVLKAL